jgi:hypothetical protein
MHSVEQDINTYNTTRIYFWDSLYKKSMKTLGGYYRKRLNSIYQNIIPNSPLQKVVFGYYPSQTTAMGMIARHCSSATKTMAKKATGEVISGHIITNQALAHPLGVP